MPRFKNHKSFLMAQDPIAGASMIGIIVAIGLAAISIYGVNSGFVAAKKAQHNATLKESFQTVQPGLRAALARVARDFVFEKKCGDPVLTTTSRIASSFTDIPIFSSSGGGAAKISATKSVTAPHSQFSDEAARCSGQVIREYAVNSAKGDLVYTCLSLGAEESFKDKYMTSNKSFWSMNHSFVELIILPIDLRRDEPKTCLTVDGPGGGLKVIYTVYYAGTENSGAAPNKSDGVFYVTRE